MPPLMVLPWMSLRCGSDTLPSLVARDYPLAEPVSGPAHLRSPLSGAAHYRQLRVAVATVMMTPSSDFRTVLHTCSLTMYHHVSTALLLSQVPS